MPNTNTFRKGCQFKGTQLSMKHNATNHANVLNARAQRTTALLFNNLQIASFIVILINYSQLQLIRLNVNLKKEEIIPLEQFPHTLT